MTNTYYTFVSISSKMLILFEIMSIYCLKSHSPLLLYMLCKYIISKLRNCITKNNYDY